MLIGPPGSGKGTQAVRIARRYRVPHISTGDILRQAVRDDTPLGREVASIIAAGSLVSDELISNLVKARLERTDTLPGMLLDGFPRSPAQARLLDELRSDLFVIHIDVPDEEIIRRLSTRRICQSCSLTQSVSDENATAEHCPYCGGNLIRRDDDEPATVRRRLATYAGFAQPLLSLYRPRHRFLSINGMQAPDRVSGDIFRGIDGGRESREKA